MTNSGVAALWVVRHGESTGNVARDRAERSGATTIDIDVRDADVPLSETGRRQAADLRRWLDQVPADRRPDAVLSSPYRRAVETAEIAAAGIEAGRILTDERLRDRELGVLDLLTSLGVAELHPDEAARKRRLGRLYHRPAGGESWSDVALRLRSVLADIDRRYPGRRLMVFTHEAVVLIIRYIVEDLSESQLVDLAASTMLPNTAVSVFERDASGLRATSFGRTPHLRPASADG
ncbi:MAG TPA: histidine phosphatase family protein [Mycobacteriales bacterium]